MGYEPGLKAHESLTGGVYASRTECGIVGIWTDRRTALQAYHEAFSYEDELALCILRTDRRWRAALPTGQMPPVPTPIIQSTYPCFSNVFPSLVGSDRSGGSSCPSRDAHSPQMQCSAGSRATWTDAHDRRRIRRAMTSSRPTTQRRSRMTALDVSSESMMPYVTAGDKT